MVKVLGSAEVVAVEDEVDVESEELDVALVVALVVTVVNVVLLLDVK